MRIAEIQRCIFKFEKIASPVQSDFPWPDGNFVAVPIDRFAALGERRQNHWRDVGIRAQSVRIKAIGAFCATEPHLSVPGFQGTAIFGEGEPQQTTLVCAGSTDVFVAKYNSDGTLAWAKRAGGGNHEMASSVTVLSDGSCVATGKFVGATTFGPGEPGQVNMTALGGYDVFVAKFDPDGTLAWAK